MVGPANISQTHERRKKSNLQLGLVLGGFVALVFAITVAKMMAGHNMEAFDHVARPQLIPLEEAQ